MWAFLRMLTSSHNDRIKLVRELLHQRDTREREHLFVAEGFRLTEDFIQAGLHMRFGLVAESAHTKLQLPAHPGLNWSTVTDSIMRSLSKETTPPGILAVFDIPDTRNPQRSAEKHLPILVLDGIREPGNLGACLRVAAGADCRLVVLAPGCVDAYNPKVVRGGMGAHARVMVMTATWDEVAFICQGRMIYAAEASGTRRYDEVFWYEPSALIIGGEANGISQAARTVLNDTVMIPLANRVESLNAAVACAVILFEASRQRNSR